MAKVNCSLLDNIIYDFEHGKLPIDNINNGFGVNAFSDGLTWEEETKLKKYYNLAIQHGNKSVYHLKLIYIVADIIKTHNKQQNTINRVIKGNYNNNYYDKYY